MNDSALRMDDDTPSSFTTTPTTTALEEETLVSDPRAGLTPAQLVERKLLTALQNSPLLASRVHSSRAVRR